MQERRLRVGSLFEWLAAAAGVVGLIWLLSGPVQHLTGPRVDAALVDLHDKLPPGVPGGATSVPVLLLLDGRALRVGLLESQLRMQLPESAADGPAHISSNEFGDRSTRPYKLDGVRFYVVCERSERGGPMRVSGVFVP